MIKRFTSGARSYGGVFQPKSVFDRGRHIDVDDGYLLNKSDSAAIRPIINQQQSPVRDLLSDLKSCTIKRDLQKGRGVHTDAVKAGIDSNIYVATALINFYAKCGSMDDARTVFDSIQEPNVVSWNSLILGYADNGQGLVALDLFSRMKKEGRCAPKSLTYVAALKACMSLAEDGGAAGKRECLERGRQIHSDIGCHMDHLVQSRLITLYAKCGSMEAARTVFESIKEPDLVSWNCLILGYAENGQGVPALELFSRMKIEGKCAPNSFTYVAALKSCSLLATDGAGKRMCLETGRQIHSDVGCHMDHFVQSTLVNLYAKCGSMEDARTLFDSVKEPNVVSWNSLILGYADNGQGLVALDLFSRMKKEGRCAPKSSTYLAALKACTSLADEGEAGKRDCLERGRQIHSDIGRHMDYLVQSTLIKMYAKCGSMEAARTVFDSIKDPDVVSWTALILGYVDNGQGRTALNLFSRMKVEGRCAPNSFTYAAALKACTLLAADGGEAGKRECLEKGRQIHSHIGDHMDRFVQSTLINLYAKCSSMDDARTVFDSIKEPELVSWNCLILGYTEKGQAVLALDLFSRMKVEGRCAPNSFTYVAALKACTLLAADGEAGKRACLERGRQIHSDIGGRMEHFIQSTLINLYAKCGSMEDARTVFDSINEPTVESWTALIWGYVENGQGLVALDMFSKMKDGRTCAPDPFTYVAALMACCSIGALAIGRRIHAEISNFDPHVVTCLIDFYAKCGSMKEAREVFDLHPRVRNLPTWNAILAGYALFGDTDSVFSLFEAMQDQGFKPDGITFLCILSCCSHAGLIEKAREYLEVMPIRYGVTPTVKHYGCMIDLLGRANKLDEAVAVLQKMHCDPDVVTWTALLCACRKWKNTEIGSWAFKSLMELDPKNAPSYAYVLMAEIYGSRGMWEEQERVLEAKMKFGACKLPENTVKVVVGEEISQMLKMDCNGSASYYSFPEESI